MNSLLEAYFKRLSSTGSLTYSTYQRQSEMPFSVHLKFTSQHELMYNSWGSGKALDDALGIALMEMIERIYFSNFSPFHFKKVFKFFQNPPMSIRSLSEHFKVPEKHLHPSNSNGVAIHLFKARAVESALNELIERHTILYSFIFSIHPNGAHQKSIGGKLCNFFWWRSSNKTTTVVGAVLSGSGYYYSSGCSKNFEDACKKAENELNSFIFLDSNHDPALDFRIKLDDIDSFNRYHRYSGDDKAFRFLAEQTSSRMMPELNREYFYYTEIPQPPTFNDLPNFHCVRVIHPDAQQLFFDNWKICYINPRLIDDQISIPSFPHIIA